MHINILHEPCIIEMLDYNLVVVHICRMLIYLGADGKVEESLALMKDVEELKTQKRSAEVT